MILSYIFSLIPLQSQSPFLNSIKYHVLFSLSPFMYSASVLPMHSFVLNISLSFIVALYDAAILSKSIAFSCDVTTYSCTFNGYTAFSSIEVSINPASTNLSATHLSLRCISLLLLSSTDKFINVETRYFSTLSDKSKFSITLLLIC